MLQAETVTRRSLPDRFEDLLHRLPDRRHRRPLDSPEKELSEPNRDLLVRRTAGDWKLRALVNSSPFLVVRIS